MNSQIPCYAVKDMLPQFAEGLLSPESEEAVRRHLEECEECRKLYKQMTAPEPVPEEDAREVDYLKKVKRNRARTVIIAIAAAALIAAGCLVFFLTRPPETLTVNYDEGSKTVVVYGKDDCDGLELPDEVNEAQNLDAQFSSFHISVYLPLLRTGESSLQSFIPDYLDRTNKSLQFIRGYLRENCSDLYPAERADKYVELTILPGDEYTWSEEDERITLKIGSYYWHREELYILSLLGKRAVQWKQLGYVWYLGSCVDPYAETLLRVSFDEVPDYEYGDVYVKAGGTAESTPENYKILNDAVSYVCLTEGMYWGTAYESVPLKYTGVYSAGNKLMEEGDNMSVCMATSFIAYLTNEYGFDKVSEFCFGNLKFDLIFGTDFASAYNAWSEWIISTYGD